MVVWPHIANLVNYKNHVLKVHKHLFEGDNAQKTNWCETKCPMCFSSTLMDLTVIFGHLQLHMQNGTLSECPFVGCNSTYNIPSSFRSHLSRKHVHETLSDLKDCWKQYHRY